METSLVPRAVGPFSCSLRLAPEGAFAPLAPCSFRGVGPAGSIHRRGPGRAHPATTPDNFGASQRWPLQTTLLRSLSKNPEGYTKMRRAKDTLDRLVRKGEKGQTYAYGGGGLVLILVIVLLVLLLR